MGSEPLDHAHRAVLRAGHAADALIVVDVDEVELVDSGTAPDPAGTDDVIILNETDFSGDDPSFMGGGPEFGPSDS